MVGKRGRSRMTEAAFSHEVMFYEDDASFLEAAVPFIRCGLEAEEPILVAVGKAKKTLLEGELGRDAAPVRFADMVELGRNPARIIPAWRDFLGANLAPGRGVRGIGEPIWPGRSGTELDECRRHEWLLNVAFGDGPGWSLLCPYDSGALDDDVLEEARENHPRHHWQGELEQSNSWQGLDAFSPFGGSLPTPPSGARAFAFGREQLGETRALAGADGRDARLTDDRAGDLAIAVGELAANSIRHGGGRGTLRSWREPDALILEIEDAGHIDDPLVGRLRPTLEQQGGRGLWMANQLCDLVQIRSGPEGTTVRLHMRLS